MATATVRGQKQNVARPPALRIGDGKIRNTKAGHGLWPNYQRATPDRLRSTKRTAQLRATLRAGEPALLHCEGAEEIRAQTEGIGIHIRQFHGH